MHQRLTLHPRDEATRSDESPSKALAYGLGIGLPVGLAILAVLLLVIYKLQTRLQGTQAALTQAHQLISPVSHSRVVSQESGSEVALVQEPRAAMPGTMMGAGAVYSNEDASVKGKRPALGGWNEMSYVDPYTNDRDLYAY